MAVSNGRVLLTIVSRSVSPRLSLEGGRETGRGESEGEAGTGVGGTERRSIFGRSWLTLVLSLNENTIENY